MENFKLLLVLSVFLCLGKSEFLPLQPTGSAHPNTSNATTSVAPNPVTPTTPTPIISTPTPNITTHTPNVTTHTPNVTTHAPNTTTPAPHTTTVSPNTTTTHTTTPLPPSPNTTTSHTTTAKPTPTTTAKPTPIPDPSIGKWSLNFTNSNSSCLLIDAALQIEILNVNSTSQKINIPINATVDGDCNNTLDSLKLVWGKDNFLNMNFDQNATKKTFELASIQASINVSLPGGTYKILNLVHNKPEFSTLLNHSYKCAKVQTLNLTASGKNDTVAFLHISHTQLQAFSNVTQHKFYDAIDCEASAITSDVVPIVVGCVLAILVVVVLVAYLIGRRRCQSRGYLSM